MYNVSRHKAVAKKILPVPEKRVSETKQLIYKYEDIEGSLRYKASNRNINPLEIEKETAGTGRYVIEKHDTLLKIADKFNIHISDILTLNNLRPDSSIAEGQKINLPCEQCRIDNITKAEYTVQSGDRLSFIAADFDLTVDAILKANKLSKSSTIRVGQKLTLPLPGRLAIAKKIPILPKKVEVINVVSKKKKETVFVGYGKPKEIIAKKDDARKVAILEPIVQKIDQKKKSDIKESVQKDTSKKQAEKKEALAKKEALVKEALAKKELVKKALAKKEALAKATKRKKAFAKKEATKKKKAKLKLALLEKKKKKKKLKTIRNLSKRKLRVTATAYSSHARQTDSTPFLAAWNNRIRPGMKIIAVSRDMLTRYGLRNGSKVRIGGLSGHYTVRDKMNKRFKKRIDIYMGIDRRKALKWGRRSVMLYW